MKFIDKAWHEEEANIMIDEFIDSGWNEEESSYCGIAYKQLPKSIRLLITKSQDSLCCYCLKALDDSGLTLEHVIPESLNAGNQSEFDRYGSYIPKLATHVIPGDQFRQSRAKRETPPYPHDIAWYNLLASCNHPDHCNHKRQNLFIIPIPLDPTLAEAISYFKDGICFSGNMELTDTLKVLNLNQSMLKKIRSVWFFLAERGYQDVKYISNNKKKILAEIDKNFDTGGLGLKGTFDNDANWGKLISYGYFLTQATVPV